MDDRPMLTNVTYQAEQVFARDVVLGKVEEERERLMYRIIDFVAQRHGVIVPRSDEVLIETSAQPVLVPRFVWGVLVWLPEIRWFKVMTLTVWAWPDARPEHRERLAHLMVEKPERPISMLSTSWRD